MELPLVSNYFRLSSEMLSRTSSQMCGRWYLPMFLFRDGLFTLMYKASFIVLKRLWSSLPKMVKLSMVTLWPEMLTWSCMGDGAFRCSLYLSSKFLADSLAHWLWSSLPKMVKLSMVTLWPEMLTWSCMGDGAFRCSLYLSSKFLADSLAHWQIPSATHLGWGSA